MLGPHTGQASVGLASEVAGVATQGTAAILPAFEQAEPKRSAAIAAVLGHSE